MAETFTTAETTAPARPRRFAFKPSDIIFGVVFVAIVVILLLVLLGQLHTHQEVAAATKVTDTVALDIKQQDAKAAWNAGDPTFQAHHSQAQLATLFTSAKSYVQSTPQLVRKTVLHGTKTDSVSNIYKFNGKPALYVRVIVTHEANSWKVIDISGNTTEAPLLKT